MSAAVNVAGSIGLEKKTLKLIGKVVVGSACAVKLQVPTVSVTAWLTVTFKLVIAILLSVDVEAVFVLRVGVSTEPAAIDGIENPILAAVNLKSKF